MIVHQANTQGYLIANQVGKSAGEKLAGVQQASSSKPLSKGEQLKNIGEHLNVTKQFYSPKDSNFSPLTSSDADVQTLKSQDNSQQSSASSLKNKENTSISTEATGGIKTDDNLIKQKNEVIDRLIAPGMSDEDKQKVKDAFKHSSVEQLQKVADNGTQIYINPKIPEGKAGCYNALNNKVEMAPSEFKDPGLLKHSLNHEVLGHAYFAAKDGEHTPKALKAFKRIANPLIRHGFNVSTNKDINDVRDIYHDFRDRVRTDKAVKVKNFNEGLDKIEGDNVPTADFMRLMKENHVEINLKGVDSLPKEKVREVGNSLLGADNVTVKKNQDETTEISFKETFEKKGEIIKKLPLAFLAATVAAPFTGGLSAVGAGLALFGAEKLTSSIRSNETKSGEREVSLGGYTANMKQDKEQFSVTVPKDAKISFSQWSDYAFKTKDPEEYMAEGQALMNKSPESREFLKMVDSKLYNYLSDRM
jgi:hypothetical protein